MHVCQEFLCRTHHKVHKHISMNVCLIIKELKRPRVNAEVNLGLMVVRLCRRGQLKDIAAVLETFVDVLVHM